MKPPRDSKDGRTVELTRMRRVQSWRPYGAVLLIVLGLFPVGVELYRYWILDRGISGVVIAIGGTMAFIGAFMLDRTETKDAAAFIVDRGLQIVAAIPRGIASVFPSRRASDPPGTVVVLPEKKPEPEPEPKP